MFGIVSCGAIHPTGQREAFEVIRDERRGKACIARRIGALGAYEALQELDELLALLVEPAREHFPVRWHIRSPDE